MIWQEKVSLIVMLTKLVENGKTKSDHYWPFDQQKEEACEGISIEMVSSNVGPPLKRLYFSLMKLSMLIGPNEHFIYPMMKRVEK